MYAQAASLQEPNPQVGEPNPNIGGYSQGGVEHPQRLGDNVYSDWNGQQSSESPFVDRTSSFGGWVDTNHQGSPNSGHGLMHSGQALSRLGQNQSPNHQLELNPETSEHFSHEHHYSDTPRLSGHMAPQGSGVYPSHLQSQTDQQTNGNATDWQHHANMAKTFQHI